MTLPAIAIHGDGAAGWLVAATLALKAGDGAHVCVLPSARRDHGLGPFGPALHLLPQCLSLPVFRALLAGGLLPAHALTPSLGIGFLGWGADGGPAFLPWGETGAPLQGVPFHQLAGRLRAGEKSIRLSDWSLAALAAREGRVAAPSDDPRSLLSTIDWSAIVHADALAAALRRLAEGLGVRSMQVDAVLEIDCSGDAPADGWESWAGLLPVDHVHSSVEPAPAAPPFALHVAEATGWRANTPLPGLLQRTTFHAASVAPPPPHAVPFRSGMLRQPWRGNHVSIGASACLIEPLLGTALLEAGRSAERLAGLLPAGDAMEACAGEYNRLTGLAAHRLRDTVLALWATNGREEPLWRRARDAALPEALARKLAGYRSRGDVPMEDGEMFEADDWVMLLDGQGIRPRRHSVLATGLRDGAIAAHFERVRASQRAALAAMPVQR